MQGRGTPKFSPCPTHRYEPHIMSPRSLLLAFAFTLAFAPLSTAAPQDTKAGKDFAVDPSSTEALDLIAQRSRDQAHPGDALEIIGLGQGDNDFRTGMHAAARGDYVPAAVDSVEAYARQVAMFESGAGFDRALIPAFPERDSWNGRGQSAEGSDARDTEAEAQPASTDTTWIGILVAMIATVCLYVTRPSGRL